MQGTSRTASTLLKHYTCSLILYYVTADRRLSGPSIIIIRPVHYTFRSYILFIASVFDYIFLFLNLYN